MKKLIAVIMMMVMVLSTTAVAASQFPDVASGAWYENHVNALVDAGIIVGYANGNFGPNDVMNADQFIKTMVVALGYNLANGENYWAETFIAKARDLGIINAYEYGSQAVASSPINRAQMAKICDSTIQLLEGSKTYTMGDDIVKEVPDINDIKASGYEIYIKHVYEIGIITGTSDGSFMPYKTLTRAEASTVIHRIIDTSERQPFEPEYTSGIAITEYDEPGIADVNIVIHLYIEVEPQYIDAESYLLTFLDQDTVDEMMVYVKSKTDRVQILDTKFWYTSDWKIQVGSNWGNPNVFIFGFRR